MRNINKDSTLEEIIADMPSAAEIFETYGIDYCCGGKATLEKACAQRGIYAGILLARLAARVGASTATSSPDQHDAMSLTELTFHIESEYHAKLWLDLDSLDALTAKVAAVHGGKDERLARIRTEFQRLFQDLSEHMVQEERILFPLIRNLDSAEPGPFSHLGSLAVTIRKMATEHERAEAAFLRIRDLADGFAPPAHACTSYRSMLSGLEALESGFREHMLMEHGMLLPRALKREEAKDALAISRILESDADAR